MKKYAASDYGYDSDYDNSWSSYIPSGNDKWLVKQLWKAGQFIRGIGFELRYGEISRAPLQLLRLQLVNDALECEWLARPLDPWDKDLTISVRQRHASLQTILDAINVRSIVFETFPHINTAFFRVYRDSPEYEREMIVFGCVQRNDHSSRNVHSLVMRAKALGFRFDLNGDVLHSLSIEE